MRVSIDTSEVERLAVDLGRTSVTTGAMMRKLARGAGSAMKKQMVAEASGVAGDRVAAAISYDVKMNATGFEVEVGPVEGGAGSLAFFYYGNSKLTSPMIADPIHTLRDEAQKTEAALAAGVAAFLGR